MTGPRAGVRRLPPILLALLLTPVALVLGYLGYREADPALSVTDALYSTLQLFTVGGGTPKSGTPWRLDVARFLAPVAVVYAAVLAAIALLRDRAEALWVRLVARDHVVLVGLGATGVQVAQGLVADARRVVAVELDSRSPQIAAARAAGVRVVPGDATTAPSLRRARVDRASDVVVLTGDDSRNLQVASEVRALARGRTRRLGLHVALHHLELWRELSRLRLVLDEAGTSTEYVHLADRAALRLLDQLAARRPERLNCAFVDGSDAMAARVVTHLIRRSLIGAHAPTVLVGDGLRQRLDLEEPWLRPHLADVGGAGSPDVVLVCGAPDDDAAAIARGLQLATRHPAAEVVVTVHHEGGENGRGAAGALGRVELVPPRVEKLGQELLRRSAVELMAQARHADYLAQQAGAGVTPEENPSLRPWAELPEVLQESNRLYAQSVARVLGEQGAELVPLTGHPASGSPLDQETIDVWAKDEHARWMRDLKAAGWTRTHGPRDNAAKQHPLLKHWDELTEVEKDLDRQSVRDLPAMLARLGYAIVWPAGQTG